MTEIGLEDEVRAAPATVEVFKIVIPAPGLPGEVFGIGFKGTVDELRAAVKGINAVTDAKATRTVEQEVEL